MVVNTSYPTHAIYTKLNYNSLIRCGIVFLLKKHTQKLSCNKPLEILQL